MRSLNLDQLRALIEVVELDSFTQAAKRLHLMIRGTVLWDVSWFHRVHRWSRSLALVAR
jgi:hypothetical protein